MRTFFGKILFFVVGMVVVSPVFAITPKEQKGVITLKSPGLEYLSPAWLTPFSLGEAPEDLTYRQGLLPEQDRNASLYIVMPTLGVVSPVIEVPEHSLDYQTMVSGREIDINKYLVDGVMHYPGTPRPNQDGNIVIFGHSNFFAAQPGRYKTIFADIMMLDPIREDEIWLYHRQADQSYELYKYRIEKSYETHPTDVEILRPQGGKELTVFACTNGLAGRWILRARQLPDEELLVPSSLKVRLWGLQDRFERLSLAEQERIRLRIVQEIDANEEKLIRLPRSREVLMERYLHRRVRGAIASR